MCKPYNIETPSRIGRHTSTPNQLSVVGEHTNTPQNVLSNTQRSANHTGGYQEHLHTHRTQQKPQKKTATAETTTTTTTLNIKQIHKNIVYIPQTHTHAQYSAINSNNRKKKRAVEWISFVFSIVLVRLLVCFFRFFQICVWLDLIHCVRACQCVYFVRMYRIADSRASTSKKNYYTRFHLEFRVC